MKIPSLNKEGGAVLLMIVIVTMALLTIGTTMLLVNSADTTVISHIEQDDKTISIPDKQSNNLIPGEDNPGDDFYGAENWPFAYYNYDNPLGYKDNIEHFKVDFFNQNLPPAGVSSDGVLIIPPRVGTITLTKDYTYKADHGIYFGTDMTHKGGGGDSQITLESVDGIIKIAKTGSITLHKEIKLFNTNGDVIVESGGELYATQTGSQGNIEIEAGNNVILNGAILKAGVNISITAGKLIDLRGARLTAGTKNKDKITLTLTGGTPSNKAQILVDQAIFNRTVEVIDTPDNTYTITGTPSGNYNTNPKSPYT
jgi:hypothetical protein